MADFESFLKGYRQSLVLKLGFIAVCIVLMVAMAAVSITIGGYDISATEVYETIFRHLSGSHPDLYSKEWYDNEIVWNTRLPRVLFGILAGAALAVSGVAMQSVMRNPLAEPYTTGVSSGAYLGMAVSIGLGITIAGTGDIITALIFALIPVSMIVLMSPRLNGSVATLILIGTALTYMFNAFSTLILVSVDAETLADVYRWQIGSLGDITWNNMPAIACTVIVGTAAIWLLTNKLNLMALGDENAKSLGVNVRRLRILCLVIMAGMVAVVVVYSGIIGFIGLICPHIVRIVLGADNRFILPASAAFGAAFLLTADTIAKYLSAMDSIPVGAIASLIGAPIFLFILMRNKRQVW